MWEYLELPMNGGGLCPGEAFVGQCVTTRMQEYGGTIFFCCSPRDKERIDSFTQAAQRTGRQVSDSQVCFRETDPSSMAKAAGKKALFVHHSMQEYLGQYLSACPTDERHLLLYSRRFGNGLAPHMSAFLDFWLEQNVDALDLCTIDEAKN